MSGGSPEEPPFQLVILPNGANYDFSWNSLAGKFYDLVSSTDLASAPLTWAVYDPDGIGGNVPYGNIPSQGAETLLEGVPGSGPRRFFAVVEKDEAPPATPVVVANLGVSGQNSSEGLTSFASKLTGDTYPGVLSQALNP